MENAEFVENAEDTVNLQLDWEADELTQAAFPNMVEKLFSKTKRRLSYCLVKQ